MSELAFRPATRKGVNPLIALYGESGCGKTFSAMLLARGIAGKDRIGMIDTESGRGSLYADVIPGGYEVMELDAPFAPARYRSAIEAAEQQNLGALVIDSMSHEWEGIGGVLDMAGEKEHAGKKGLAVWKEPKMEHAKMVLKLLQARVPLILCLRAKYKSRQKGGQVIKDDVTSPIQAEDFIFEMMAHAEVLRDHTINLTKCSHPDLRACFPDKRPIRVEDGEAIARWAAGSAAQPVAQKAKASPAKTELWKLTEQIHGNDKTIKGAEMLEKFLRDMRYIKPDESLATLPEHRLADVVSEVKSQLEAAAE